MDLQGGALKFDAIINDSNFNARIKAMEDRILGIYNITEGQSNRLNEAFSTLSQRIAGAFSIGAIAGFAREVINIRGEFQKLEVAFATMLKSKEAADKLMGEAVALAATTPFGLQDVASGAKQLLAYGTGAKDIIPTLTMLGNVASGVGAPLNDIVYLYGTLQTQGRAYSKDIQQFTGRGIPIIKELAAQFNIAEGEVMGMVEAGKVGFPEVQKAFRSMTSESGLFFNLMQEQSKTLSGLVANLEDAWDMMLNSIGKSQEGLIGSSIELAIQLVENYDKVLSILAALVAGYGAYKAAIAASMVMESSSLLLKEVALIYGARLNTMQKLHVLWIAIETKARAALNAVMLANPYAIVAAAAVALGVAMYALHNSITATQKAQQELNDESQKSAKNFEDMKAKASALTDVIRDKNATEFQQSKAFKELQTIYPALLANMSKETFQKLESAAAQKQLNEENDKIQVSGLGKRFQDAKDRVVAVTNEIKRYRKIIIEAGDQGGGITKTITNLKFELEVANTKAKELGKEFEKQREEYEYSKMNDKQKIEYLNQQKNKLLEQKKAMEDLNKLSGGLQSIFDSYNMNNLLNQIDKVDVKLNGFRVGVEKIRTLGVIDKEIENLRNGFSDTSTRSQHLVIEKKILELEKEKAKITGKTSKESVKAENDEVSAMKRKADMIERIYDLNQKYNNKALSDDKAALQAIRDEFKSLQKDIDAYNKDKKNVKINPNLQPALEKALQNQTYTNETERLKKQIDIQKQIYTDYETYKTEVGKNEADDRYKNEIDTNVSLLQKLKSERDLLLSKGTVNLSDPERNRIISYNEYIRELESVQKKQYQDAFKAAMSHEENIQNIREKYAEYSNKLNEKITDAKRSELTRQMDDEIKAANQTAFEKTEVYKKLAQETVLYTKEALKAEIKAAQNLLKDSTLPDDLRKQIQSQLDDLNSKLNIGVNGSNTAALEERKKFLEKAIVSPLNEGTERAKGYRRELIEIQRQIDGMGGNSDVFTDLFKGGTSEVAGKISGKLGDLSGSFGELSSSLEGVNDDLAYTIGSVGQLLKVGSDAAGSVAAFASGDVIGGVTKAISAVAGLFSMGKKVKEMNEKARAEQQKYYDDAIKGEMEYQALLRKRELDEVARGKTSYQSIISRLETLKKQAPALQEAYEKVFSSLQGQQFVDGVGYEHGTWLRKAKTWDIMASLAGSDYARLEQLYLQGKLKDQVKSDFEAMKSLREEMEDAGVDLQELQSQLKELMTGTSVEGLSDAFADLFENGNLAAEDFGQSLESILKKAIVNGFKYKVIEKAMAPLFDELAKAGEDGIYTKAELENWRNNATKTADSLKAQWDAITAGLDIDFTGDKSSASTGLPGAIRKEATEQSVNELAAVFRGYYDIEKRILALQEKAGMGFQDQMAVMNKQLFHLARIDQNTEISESHLRRLESMETSLKTIATNTKSSSSRDLPI